MTVTVQIYMEYQQQVSKATRSKTCRLRRVVRSRGGGGKSGHGKLLEGGRFHGGVCFRKGHGRAAVETASEYRFRSTMI